MAELQFGLNPKLTWVQGSPERLYSTRIVNTKRELRK